MAESFIIFNAIR